MLRKEKTSRALSKLELLGKKEALEVPDGDHIFLKWQLEKFKREIRI